MATTIQGLRDRLLTDPSFIFHYIYGNNPDAVIENMRALGFSISSADDVFGSVNQLLEKGRTDLVHNAFSVPILTDQMDPTEIAMVKEVMNAYQNLQR